MHFVSNEPRTVHCNALISRLLSFLELSVLVQYHECAGALESVAVVLFGVSRENELSLLIGLFSLASTDTDGKKVLNQVVIRGALKSSCFLAISFYTRILHCLLYLQFYERSSLSPWMLRWPCKIRQGRDWAFNWCQHVRMNTILDPVVIIFKYRIYWPQG